jgi:glutamyl-tRNA reductase
LEFLNIGLNHKTAPLEVREKVSFTSSQKESIYKQIKQSDKIYEGVILNTCNRTEILMVSDHIESAKRFGLKIIETISGVKAKQLKNNIFIKSNIDAVKHLFNVVCGIDSQIIGEVQILGQIKRAYKRAKSYNVVDTYLHKLFEESIRLGKRVRTKTDISKKATSVSYAAVELARKIFGSLNGETVLILGAGETSELTLKSLVDYGIKGVMVANRTYDRGKKLAKKYDGKVIKWRELNDWIKKVDIVIGSTAAPHYVLYPDDIKRVAKKKKDPMLIIDIAVPRDVEPTVDELPGVHLYDIDDLETVVDNNIEDRKGEIKAVKSIITDETNNFRRWKRTRKCVPLIKEMRQKAGEIKNDEVERALNKLSEESNNPEEIIEELSHRLINKLLHTPTVGVKKMMNREDGLEILQVIKEDFYE